MTALAGSARAGTPPLPVISNQVFVVTNTTFAGGAYGNGSSNSTAAINAAITYAAGHGGGTVEIPPVGTLTNYLSGPITLASQVNLQIDGGAKLQMFPMSTWVSNYGSSTPFVSGTSLTDVEISGSGIIDGQGTNWWSPLASSRPHFIEFNSCTRVLIQNVRLQNPPTFHIYMKTSDTSVTVQGITINTPFDSHNTDGFDITSTNVLIQNCSISTGDDDIEIGGSAAATDITVSNCTFGTGHGVSIGSYTQGGVNNLIVSNCSWNGTEYGLKIKTDRDRGGVMQNLKYCDLTMTNVNFPIAFYMDYNTLGSPSKSITVTPANAAADTTDPTNSTTPYFRNITISNLTAVGNSGVQGPGNIAGIIYGVPESPVTNVTLSKVNILGRSSGQGTFCIYHARGIKIIDSNLTAPTSGTNTLTLYNAEVSLTNSAANPNVMTITGLGSPSNSVLSLFNGQASTADASVLGGNPVLTLAGGTLTVNNSMSVGASSKLNYGLGTNVTDTAVTGNLTLGGTLNVADGGGFTTGTYSLFTYGGTLSYNGLTVGSTPNPSFTYTVSTNTHGQVNLVVASSCSVGAAGTISGSTSVAAGTSGVTYSISSVSGATTYAWTVPTGATVASGQGTTSITVNYSCTAASGNVTVTPSNGSCNGTAANLPVTVTSVGAAGTVSGSTSVAAGASGVNYSISGVSGATTYTWSVPTGASIASGQGTTSITVNYSCSAVSGNVTVTPSNANGCNGSAGNLSVTVTGVGAAGSISGSSSVASGTNGVVYSISSVSGATTYAWTVPTGATIASGQGTTSITVNYSCSAASGNITVTPSNGTCSGTLSSRAVTVTGVAAAGSISGLTSVTAGTNGVAYSISGVSGATTYTWTVPSGASVASGQGTTSITVNYSCGAASGNVAVTPSNGSCSGTPGSLSVTVTGVGAAGSVSGPSSVAAGMNGVAYSISSVSGATTYTWRVPGGASIASGQGTTSITVDYSCDPLNGNVQVTPANANGCTGTAGSLSITVIIMNETGSISGPTTVCAGQTGAGYSISSVGGATTYTWAAPTGATVASGQGTTSIAVNWGSIAGNVTVTAANGNGCTNMASVLPVAVNAAPGILSSPSPQAACDGGSASFTVSASGAGLSYQWRENGSNISDGGTINGSGTNILTLTGVGTGDSGASFDCVVSGTCGLAATSGGATLTVNANPATFNVTGGGAYCAAGGGVAVGLDGSESCADYQLELNGNPTGAPLAGTGSALSFSNQTAVGTYTVLASNVTSGSTAPMNGSASVTPGDPFACWQLQYFGCTNLALCPQAAPDADPDGDGQNNMAEFLSGTDPTNSASFLHIITAVAQGSDVVVTWKTAGGHTNAVQAAAGAVDGSYATNFTDLSGPIVILGTGDVTTNYTDSGGATNVPSRFYRVRLVP